MRGSKGKKVKVNRYNKIPDLLKFLTKDQIKQALINSVPTIEQAYNLRFDEKLTSRTGAMKSGFSVQATEKGIKVNNEVPYAVYNWIAPKISNFIKAHLQAVVYNTSPKIKFNKATKPKEKTS